MPAIALSAVAQNDNHPLRITAFGTSLTADPQIWPAQLAQQLTSCRTAPVHVTAIAGPGMGSAWGLQQLDRVTASRADLILLEFSINDGDARDGVSLTTSRQQHQALIAQLQTSLPDVPIVLMTMSPAHGPRGWVRPRLRAFYQLYTELAAEFDLALVDHYARWRARPRDARGLDVDGLHPDPTVAAQVILPQLMRVILPWSGSNSAHFGCEIPS